jgi:hypothetical protein
MNGINKNSNSSQDSTLEHYSGYSPPTLTACVYRIKDLLSKEVKEESKGNSSPITEKYRTQTLQRMSTIVLLEVDRRTKAGIW